MKTRANVVDAKGRVLGAYEATDITSRRAAEIKAQGHGYACACGVKEYLVGAGTTGAFFKTAANASHPSTCRETVADGHQGKWRQLELAIAENKPLVIHLRLPGIDRRLPLPPLVELEEMIQRATGRVDYHEMTARSIKELTDITAYVRALHQEYRMRGNQKKRPPTFVLHKNLLRPVAEMLVTEDVRNVRAMLQDVARRGPANIEGKLRYYPAPAYLFRLSLHDENSKPRLASVTEVPRQKPAEEFWQRTWVTDPVAVQTETMFLLDGSQVIKGIFPWNFVRFSLTTNDTQFSQQLKGHEAIGILASLDEKALQDMMTQHIGENGENRVLDIPIAIKDTERQVSLSLGNGGRLTRPWPGTYRPILG